MKINECIIKLVKVAMVGFMFNLFYQNLLPSIFRLNIADCLEFGNQSYNLVLREVHISNYIGLKVSWGKLY